MKTITISRFNIKSIQIDPDNMKATINILDNNDIESFVFNIDSIHKPKLKQEILTKEVFNTCNI